MNNYSSYEEERVSMPMPYMNTMMVESAYGRLARTDRPRINKTEFLTLAKAKAFKKRTAFLYREEDIYELCGKTFPHFFQRFPYLGSFQESFT